MLVMFIQLMIALAVASLFLYLRWRFHWRRLHRYESKISGYIDICEKYNKEKVLMTNYFVQGVSIEQPSISKSYWYRVASEILRHCDRKRQSKILFIGLGANTSSLLVNRKNSKIHQVIVEIDPLVITACQEYFQLDELTNTEIVTADIFALLTKKKTSWKATYDVIVIDTFDANPPYLLHNSHDARFLEPLSYWLKTDGMFIFNIPVKTTGKDIPALLKLLKTMFTKQTADIVKDPRGYRNHVITAVNKRK